LSQGESVLLEDIAVQHIFTDPADYSQDAGIEEGVREFLSRGVEWCQQSSKQSSKTKKKQQTKQMKKEKKKLHKQAQACAAWAEHVRGLYALHPASVAASSDSVLARYGRYRTMAQRLAADASDAALGLLREASCCGTDEDAVLLLIAVLRSNSFTAADDTTTVQTGTAVGLRTSFLNHECHPNARVRVLPRQLSVVAIDPIEVGEEIVITYLSYWQLEHEREAKLSQYLRSTAIFVNQYRSC
jgi:hypothetical protein